MIDDVLHFWFVECEPHQWWTADPAFDERVRQRFGALHAAAAAAECWTWRVRPEGRLAEVIVLDQFSSNLHRGTPRAFACDTMALVLAQDAVACGADAKLEPQRRHFLYMPYMHSESRPIHEQAQRLVASLGLLGSTDAQARHQAIVERFGRYPHRNAILGRASTAEELEFLQQPGSSF